MNECRRIGVVGINSVGLYLLERLKLRGRYRVIVAVDLDANRESLTRGFAESFSSDVGRLETEPLDCLVVTDRGFEESIATALQMGRSVVLAQPWTTSKESQFQFREMSERTRRPVLTFCPRRYSPDFQSALAAVATQRLGAIRTARFSIAEMSLPSASPEEFLREQIFHLFDQLLLLVDSKPVQVFARAMSATDSSGQLGRVIVVEFANGCRANIDLQFRSRLGDRTGWELEGEGGSYHQHRIYTTTVAGEIVDEPLPQKHDSDELFFDQLDSLLAAHPGSLETLTHSMQVVQLLECVEQSCSSGEVIRGL